ncbi:MAG: mechanosensitive ion channel family protein, partial [Thermoanaerobaculia bacterium]|nr:mechanosensitive ion channel family protein [Thermoanaerobaculia bacterium]
MNRALPRVLLLGFVLAGPISPALAQLLPLPGATRAAGAEPVGDPYRRETPHGAFFGYIRAAQKENWAVAGEFLQWPKGGKVSREELARQLKALLDERFDGDLEELSRSSAGSFNDAFASGRDLVGHIEAGEDSFDLLLARTTPVEGPGIWLVSSQSLREVPAAFGHLTTPELDRRMPVFLRRNVGGAFRLWQVLAFWALIPVAWLLARLLVTGALGLARRVFARRSFAEGFAGSLVPFRGPLALLAAVPLHAFAVATIGLPLLGRYNYGRVSRLVVIAGLAWLLICVIGLLTSRATMRLLASGASAASSLTIGRRVFQGTVILAAVLAALATLGVNLTATLAGVGIGGLAIAFAAQRSLENLFGGFLVLSDKILSVGETVRIGTVQGEIEDVTLYATRVRTLDRTVVSIPNGTLATSQIENLSRRDKFWFRHVLGLRFETTAAQMQAVLDGCRKRLAADPRVESGTLRVRFLKVNAYTLDVEIFAYLLVPDWAAFLAAQEELLLALMQAVEEAGSGFAFPTQ